MKTKMFNLTASYNNYGWEDADNVLYMTKEKEFGVLIPQPNNIILTYGINAIKEYEYTHNGQYNITLEDAMPIKGDSTCLLSPRFVLTNLEFELDIKRNILIDLYENKAYELTTNLDTLDTSNNFDIKFTIEEIDVDKAILFKTIESKNNFQLDKENIYEVNAGPLKNIRVLSNENISNKVIKRMVSDYINRLYTYEDAHTLKWRTFIFIDDYFSNSKYKFRIYRIKDKLFVTINNIFNSEYIELDDKISEEFLLNHPELLLIKFKDTFKDAIEVISKNNVYYILGYKLSYGCIVNENIVIDAHISHNPNIKELFKLDIIKELNNILKVKKENEKFNIKVEELLNLPDKELLDIIKDIPTISINDSYSVGNCEVGTRGFIKSLGLDTTITSISGKELSELIKDKNINIKNRDFIKVIAKKLLDSQED